MFSSSMLMSSCDFSFAVPLFSIAGKRVFSVTVSLSSGAVRITAIRFVLNFFVSIVWSFIPGFYLVCVI